MRSSWCAGNAHHCVPDNTHCWPAYILAKPLKRIRQCWVCTHTSLRLCVLHSQLRGKQNSCSILQMPVSWQPITSLYCVRTYYEPSDYRDLTVSADSALVTYQLHV